MPRPPRTKIKLTTDSIEQQLQEAKNQIDELRIKAVKDYHKVEKMMDTAENIQVLENSRSNSLRALRDGLVLFKDLINIQRAAKADQDKVQPSDAASAETNGATTGNNVNVDWKRQMQELRSQLKNDQPQQG